MSKQPKVGYEVTFADGYAVALYERTAARAEVRAAFERMEREDAGGFTQLTVLTVTRRADLDAMEGGE